MENLTIGELLKSARTRKKVSLEDVANKTKINMNILRSLEKDDLESLPNKTYVKGFVKNCSKILGVDTEQALKALENTYRKLDPAPAPEEESQAQEEKPAVSRKPEKSSKEKEMERMEFQSRLRGIFDNFFNKKVLISAVCLVAAVLVVKGMTTFFTSINEENKTLTESKSQDAENRIKPEDSSLFDMQASKKIARSQGEDQETSDAESVSNAASTKPAGETSKPLAEKKEEPKKEEPKKEEPEKKVAKEKESEKEEVKLPAGKFPYQRFYPAPKNLFTLVSEAEELNNDEIFPKQYKQAMKEGKHNVFINAVDGDTWLSYQVDGEDVKRYVLKKGRTLFLQADEVVLLFLGNLNAARVFYNNQLVDAKSKSGVKSLIFPETMSAEYDFPLFPSHNGIPRRQDVYKKNMMAKGAIGADEEQNQ